MSHKPIIINNISVWFKDKICFEHFSTIIQSHSKILIIGNNGVGKSTLLKIIEGDIQPTTGIITSSHHIIIGTVPQTVTDYADLSGGQRFNKSLSQALSKHPDILGLDEPTNHLDAKNKKSLIRMLQTFPETLIIISHDPEVMNLEFDEIWHIEHNKVTVFKGDYTAYRQQHVQKEQYLICEREKLQKQKRAVIKAKQKEQERASSSKAANRDERDKCLLGAMKDRGSHTVGKKGRVLADIDIKIRTGLDETFIHKKIVPSFHLNSRKLSSAKSIVSITDGACGYKQPILEHISLHMQPTEHMAIIGDNGSGKSTFLKALLHDPAVTTSGQWSMPPKNEIGYLDQHYSTLNPHETVMQALQRVAPDKNDHDIKKHLHSFLFIKPEEWNKPISHLSGGEKSRLSLAQIAAADYYLLLLDEITNNIDLQTRTHIIEVLKGYPGAMIIISHDQAFLDELSIDRIFQVADNQLHEINI